MHCRGNMQMQVLYIIWGHYLIIFFIFLHFVFFFFFRGRNVDRRIQYINWTLGTAPNTRSHWVSKLTELSKMVYYEISKRCLACPGRFFLFFYKVSSNLSTPREQKPVGRYAYNPSDINPSIGQHFNYLL